MTDGRIIPKGHVRCLAPDVSGAAGAQRAVVAAVALGTILAPLNSTMIAVALPRIMRDLHVGVGTAGWLVTAYLVALAALQPPAGRLGDRVGRRRVILAGLAGFGLASLGAALAPSIEALVAFRVLQAVTGALVFPNGAAILREILPRDRRGRGYGIVGGALASAAAVGPLVGGAIVALGGWRGIFVLDLPLVALALALSARLLPRHAAAQDETPPPLYGLAFFRRRPFAAACGGVALGNLAYYSLLVAVPLLLEKRAGWGSVGIGLALAALSASAALLTPVGGRLADRLGRRAPALAGHALLVAGGLPLAVEPHVHGPGLVACLLVVGAGVGLATAGLQTSAIEAVPPAQAGSAAGVFATSRYVGSIVGTLALAHLLAGADGFRAVFAMVLAAAGGAVAAAALLPGRRRARPELGPETAAPAAP